MKALLLLPLLALPACRPAAQAGTAARPDVSVPFRYPDSDYYATEPGRPGGALRVSVAQDTGTLDFQVITNTNAKWLGRLLFDNLVYLDPAGNPTPWLARSWEISPDGRTYTFRLREDVTFSDGTRLDAAVALANLDRMRNPATKAAMTTAYLAPYAGGRVVDPFTFEAHLSEPYSAFLNVLAQSWLGIYSGRALRENPATLAERPVGSGPFVVERYTRQQGIRLVRRSDYHWAPNYLRHAGPAYLDRIEVDFVPEALVRFSSLAAGQYDFTIDAPPQNAAAIRANPELVLASRVNLGNPTRAITFNCEQAPFDDVRVRRAFALAVDREGIERITGFGEYRLKTDFLSATTPHYDPSFQTALRYDPAVADRLLDEAGWTARDAGGYRTKDGARLGAEMLLQESATPNAVAVALQADARRIGFDLRLTQLPAAQLTERRLSGRYQALTAGFWHTNTPDGLYILYHSRQITTPEIIGQNTSRIRDAALDDLLLQARHRNDPAAQRDLYSRAQHRLTEIVPAVPIHENHTLVAHHRDVRGVVFDTSHNTPFFTAAWLAR